eukprot:COSAG02_NODE_1426_length_12664_cov_6.226980_9_plen_107_part_00
MSPQRAVVAVVAILATGGYVGTAGGGIGARDGRAAAGTAAREFVPAVSMVSPIDYPGSVHTVLLTMHRSIIVYTHGNWQFCFSNSGYIQLINSSTIIRTPYCKRPV